MALKIRLQRVGTKKKLLFRIVTVDSRKKRDGKVIDNLGEYQPISNGNQFSINEEKLIDWYKKGARPTETIENLLKKTGTWTKLHNTN